MMLFHTAHRSMLVIGLWVLQGALLLLLCLLNPNHYTTIDSRYYLQGAQSLLDGQGYLIQEEGNWVWNGHFPPFYSGCIALIAYLSNCSVLWASKMVNWFASGLLLSYFNQRVSGQNILGIGIVLCSGIFLKIWVHTWSEPLFLVVLLIWLQEYQKGIENRFLSILLLGIILVTTRYVGIFILVFIWWDYFTSKSTKHLYLLFLTLSWVAILLVMLGINYQLSGELYGGNRFTSITPFRELLAQVFWGIVNELCLFRDSHLQQITLLFGLGIGLQLVLFYTLYRSFELDTEHFTIYWKIALVYLLFLVAVRVFSPFGLLGYRLLAPFTIPLLIGFILHLKTKKDYPVVWIVFFVIMSWLHLVPYQK